MKYTIFLLFVVLLSHCQSKQERRQQQINKVINQYTNIGLILDTIFENTLYFLDTTGSYEHASAFHHTENVSVILANREVLAKQFKRPYKIVDAEYVEISLGLGKGLNNNSYTRYKQEKDGKLIKERVIKDELTFGSERISINNDTLQTGDTLMVHFKAHPFRREDTMFYKKAELYGELEDYSFYVTNKDSINNPFVDTIFFCRENKQRNFERITYKKICQQTGIHTITGTCHLKYYLRKKFVIPFEYTYLVLPKEDEE